MTARRALRLSAVLPFVFLLACSQDATSPQPSPPFSVSASTSLTARWTHTGTGDYYHGCDVRWHAQASEDTTVVSYSIATGNLDQYSQPWPPITGTFRDTITVAFAIDTGAVYVDPHGISWTLSARDTVKDASGRQVRQDGTTYPYCW